MLGRVTTRTRLPAPFLRLTAALTLAAVLAFVVAADGADLDAFGSTQYWLLAALTFGMELLPIRLPRQNADDVITVSSAFALAALFLFGPLPAMALWTGATLAADFVGRVHPLKALFNGAQYALCMAAASLTLALFDAQPPLDLTLGNLPAMLSAALAFFIVNHVLAGVGIALASGARILPFLRRDLGLLSWTTGFQLALAPMLIAEPGAIVLLGAVPVLAIYLGSRQAADATHRANHDTLTGLANRALFSDHLRMAIDEAHEPAAQSWVALVDLDDFKSINDTLGHACGDELLRHVAARARNAIREGDVLARLGGDEFAVLFARCARDDAVAAAQRILEHLAEPVRVGDLSLQVSASVGLAGCNNQAGADLVLKHADMALYDAKEHGGPIRVYANHGQSGPQAMIDRVALGSELANALDNGDITVSFQPKVAAADGLAPSMEALARWRHPQLGLIEPAVFVAVAEHTGMIKRLTERVLDLALERCAACRADGIPLRVCVNLSGKSLVDESLPTMVAGALRRHDVPGHALQFEITESVRLANVPRSSAVLRALRALGATLAIDDFGTGFSSLTQLQALDLEEVKIDRSFVMAMEHDPQAAMIVTSVVNLGHSLGLRVCAEGVESPAALGRLRELGCDYVQGYLFGQPASDAMPLRSLDGLPPAAVA